MWSAIASCWALLMGLGLLMLGHGLMGTLIGVRASVENFSTEATGIVMTGYFAGYAVGSMLVPRLVANVGHVRVFAALASMASVAALMHPIFVQPIPWFGMRVATGFCFAGLYIVAESWVNDVATNQTRGQLLSVYMVVVMGAVAASQLLLNVADPRGFELFVLVSVLVSFALVPMLLSAGRAPQFSAPRPIGILQLYRASPLGIVGAFATGVLQGSVFGMGAVFASRTGMDVEQVSWFMAALYLGAMLFQWPLGLISDRMDRRKAIIGASLGSAALAAAGWALASGSFLGLLCLALVYGGISIPLYSMFIAYTNDHLEPDQRVGASAGLVFVGGLGATIGPVSCALAMGQLGSAAFFAFLAAVHALVCGFGLFRMTRREAPPLEEQEHYPSLAPRSTPVVAAMAMRDVRDHRDRDLARWSQM